jgi:hypothetical protein
MVQNFPLIFISFLKKPESEDPQFSFQGRNHLQWFPVFSFRTNILKFRKDSRKILIIFVSPLGVDLKK